MRLDSLAGPLAFRCGCGASFNLKSPHLHFVSTRCVWQRGRFRCAAVPADSLPLCMAHATELVGKMGDEGVAGAVEQLARHRVAEANKDERERLRKYWENQEVLKQKRHDEAARGAVVYYVQIRPGQVKIGTTIHLEDRMKSMRAHQREDVLAAEPGTRDLEKARHAQFKATRIDCRREDFLESPELMSHIQMVRAHFGDPFELAARLVAQGAS
jgi:hypothetical protein